MASIRERRSSTGDTTYAVSTGPTGEQSSLTFETATAATKVKSLFDVLGPARALAERRATATAAPTPDELAATFLAKSDPRSARTGPSPNDLVRTGGSVVGGTLTMSSGRATLLPISSRQSTNAARTDQEHQIPA